LSYSGNLTQALVDELLEVVHKYDETLMLTTVIGCFEIAKLQLIQEHTDEEDEE
jgi:hypothetical protein